MLKFYGKGMLSIFSDATATHIFQQRMIARVCVFVSIRVPRYGGQQHTRGHAINLFNKPEQVVTKLPRLPSDTGIVVVRPPGNSAYAGLAEFVVRPHLVRAALLWLKQNNKWYKDIEIDEQLLQQLEHSQPDLATVEVPDDEVPVYDGSHQDVESLDNLGVCDCTHLHSMLISFF